MEEKRLHTLFFLIKKSKKYFFLVIALFVFEILANAQSLTAVSAIGSASTTSSTFSTVTGASVTVDATDINSILVVATFQLDLSFASAAVRDAGYRIVDNSDENNINSGEIHRSLSNAKSTDFGIGSVVYIFDVSGVSGDKTYVLQHNISSNKNLGTNATIVAIALKSDTEHLKNDVKRVSSPITMGTSWESVTGSETTVITSTVAGGFYVAASIESLTTSFNTSAVAEWKLQYKYGAAGLWTDLSPTIQRSMSNASDIGIINLVGSLPDSSPAGDYYFRIMHQQTSTLSTINSEAANIVAVSLGTTTGIFPVFSELATGVTTTSTTMVNAVTATMTPALNADLFLHAQYTMNASDASNSPSYDLFVNNSIFDGANQNRFISSSSDFGSGASVGLASGLTANTTYDISLRHLSTSGVALTSNNLSLNGFGLKTNSVPLPIRLLYLNSQCGQDSEIIVKWSTASETNNDYFTLYRSNDGINWIDIARITGAGNTNAVMQYKFVDKKPSLHDTYYKLKQTDYDGKSEEFKIISIYCKYNHKRIKIYPNPAKDYLTLSFNNEHQIIKPLKIQIYNRSGQVCYSQIFYSNENENLHKIILPSTLKPGVYFFHSMLGEDYFYTSQFTIIN
ncbi:MAG: T9SS type A sorting domain-containing protein [Bacteroidales bacterium]|nr:T9SS type A sorting domain-containing protein [Bacteroidales bacterium]